MLSNKNNPYKNAILGKTISIHFSDVLPHVATRCLPKSTERPALGSRTSLRTTKRGLKSELTELTISGLRMLTNCIFLKLIFLFNPYIYKPQMSCDYYDGHFLKQTLLNVQFILKCKVHIRSNDINLMKRW